MAPAHTDNVLLAEIPDASRRRLASGMELASLERGQPIFRRAGPIDHVYFPLTAVISMMGETPGGAAAEVAVVGRDGALGLVALMCGARAPFRALVDVSGSAYRIPATALRAELARVQAVQAAFLKYLTARMTTIAGHALCNGQHSIEQRFCRALLLRLERSPTNTFTLTHEAMAYALGTERAGVTRTALDLKRLGAITYEHGLVTVLDPSLVEQHACKCLDTLSLHSRFSTSLPTA